MLQWAACARLSDHWPLRLCYLRNTCSHSWEMLGQQNLCSLTQTLSPSGGSSLQWHLSSAVITLLSCCLGILCSSTRQHEWVASKTSMALPTLLQQHAAIQCADCCTASLRGQSECAAACRAS